MNEHIERVTTRNEGIVRAALVTAGVLLIPLWGNTYIDGWNWHWYTFVLAAAFVFSATLTYQLVVKGVSNKAYRFAVGLAVMAAIALTWGNRVLADENPANLTYVGVVVIGVIGAAISRLRARGMARTLFVCARHGAWRHRWRQQPSAKASREVTGRCKSSGGLDDRNP